MEKTLTKRRASVLILVLIVISSMTIIAVGLAYRTRIEIKLAHASAQRTKAHYLALGGLQRCIAILSDSELTPERTAVICRTGILNGKTKLFEQLKVKPDEQTELLYWIKDEASFWDLNNSDSASWEDSGLVSRKQRAGILDWADADSDTNPDGAETDFYENLEPSYICKNEPFVSMKELLFVKGVTYDNYLGSILNNELRQNLVGVEDEQRLFEGDSVEEIGFVNLFTVFGNATLNINTVSGLILSALPGLDEQVADTVLAYRYGPDSQDNTDDEIYFENIESISQIEGLTQLQIELLQQYCGFNCDTFRVFSFSNVRDYKCFLMATVKVSENEPQILCVERLL